MLKSHGLIQRAFFASLLTFVASSAVAGQPYKCVSADGKITFTDKKCSADAQPQKIWDSNLGSTEYPLTFSGAEPSELPPGQTSGAAAEAKGATERNCAAKWPGDYRMQEFCLKKQGEAAAAVQGIVANADAETKQILTQCAVRWKDGDTYDFSMVKFCYEQQNGARQRLSGGR